MTIKNVMENVVRDVLRQHKEHMNLRCSCQRCLDDILAISLNELQPRYIVNDEHQPYVRAMHEADKEGAMNILMVVTKAASVVSNNPRCT